MNGIFQQYATQAAGIVYNKQLDSLMIRNLSKNTWRGWSPKTRALADIKPGQEFPISPGVQIEFKKEKPKIVGEVFDPKASR